jgi:hypothetical protein
MNYWLAQLILAARDSNEKDTGWMQILVFVILSVFYALGSIVKARANKTAPKGKEQIPRKPARKPTERTRDLQMLKQLWRPEKPVAKPQVQPTHRKVARPATARSAVTSPQPAGRAMLEPQMAMPQVAEPQVQPKLGKITAGVAAPAEIPRAEYLSEILSDYDDPEKLRRAILHYEILGKPLSLREQERAF